MNKKTTRHTKNETKLNLANCPLLRDRVCGECYNLNSIYFVYKKRIVKKPLTTKNVASIQIQKVAIFNGEFFSR